MTPNPNHNPTVSGAFGHRGGESDPLQPPLPMFDLRPVCPNCGLPSDVLGQYSPLYEWFVCRDCSLATPYPIEVFIPDPKNKSGLGIKINSKSPSELRERRMWLDEEVRQAVKGIVDERPVVKYNLSGMQLYNGIRRSRHAQYGEWMRQARINLEHRQIIIPFCQRCGGAHDHRHLGDYAAYCQHCEDQMQVEALSKNKGIFGGDDDEVVLDRLHKAFKPLFDRGILPDYWFELKRKNHA